MYVYNSLDVLRPVRFQVATLVSVLCVAACGCGCACANALARVLVVVF